MIEENIKTKSSTIITIIGTLKKFTYQTSQGNAYAPWQNDLKSLNNYYLQQKAVIEGGRSKEFFEQREAIMARLLKIETNPSLIDIAASLTQLGLIAFPDIFWYYSSTNIFGIDGRAPKISGAPKEDILRITQKMMTLKKHGEKNPWLQIYDCVRFSITVNSL